MYNACTLSNTWFTCWTLLVGEVQSRALTSLQLKLVKPTQYRFEHLATQLKWRLQEGRGEAVYQIGVEDNGLLVGLSEGDMRASLKTLRRMAEKYVTTSYANVTKCTIWDIFFCLMVKSIIPVDS